MDYTSGYRVDKVAKRDARLDRASSIIAIIIFLGLVFLQKNSIHAVLFAIAEYTLITFLYASFLKYAVELVYRKKYADFVTILVICLILVYTSNSQSSESDKKDSLFNNIFYGIFIMISTMYMAHILIMYMVSIYHMGCDIVKGEYGRVEDTEVVQPNP